MITTRVHSTHMRSLFYIQHTGVDIIIKKEVMNKNKKKIIRIGIEVKETYGKRAKYCVKPKDMKADHFLFYYPPQNLYILVHKKDIPEVPPSIKATSFSLRQVKQWSFFTTTEDQQIIAEVNNL